MLLLDDDAEAEPEGILRALAFNDFAIKPTIVGGHMLNANERTLLHSFGERVNLYTFWWDSVIPELRGVDLAQQRIRTSRLLNQRVDVDYNGWWMCLIPKRVLRSVGLSLPFFIKWDDAEYGLRARDHGFPTVTLPGMAAWHVPWGEKDDGLDWQAYFHQRNRWVSALLHSPYSHGGSLPSKSLASDMKHLLSMQYSAAELRMRALEDVLRGPEHLHSTLATRASQARNLVADSSDGKLIQPSSEYPEVRRLRPLPRGEAPRPPRSNLEFAFRAVRGVTRQFRPPSRLSHRHPEERVASTDAKWWRLANVDSALIANAAGSGAWFYQRDPHRFWSLLRRARRNYTLLERHWNRLSEAYKRDIDSVVDPATWRHTFGDAHR